MPIQAIVACRARGGSTAQDVSREQQAFASPTSDRHDVLRVKLAISKDDGDCLYQVNDWESHIRKRHSFAGTITSVESSQQTECTLVDIERQVNSKSVESMKKQEGGFFHIENLPHLRSTDKLVEEYDSAMNLLISNTYASYNMQQRRMQDNNNILHSASSNDCDDYISCLELCPELNRNAECDVNADVSQSSSSLFHACTTRSSNDEDICSRKTRSLDSSKASIPDSCYISQDLDSSCNTNQTTRSNSVSSPSYTNAPLVHTQNCVYNIPIVGYKILEPRSRLTIYEIKVQLESSDNDWSVYRRYNDFVQLNEKLLESFTGIRLSLPPKRWFLSNFDPAFLEDRQVGLQSFLNNIMAHSSLRQHPSVSEFLCLDASHSSLYSCQCGKGGTGSCCKSHGFVQNQLTSLQEQLNLLRHHNNALQQALSEECKLAEQNGLQSSPVHQKNKALLYK